jgi:addiction module HigA family antidote
MLFVESQPCDDMSMKNPAHPGRIIRADCIEPLNLTVTRAAEILGVTRQRLTSLIREKSGLSAEMAIRLEKTFGGAAATWMRMQVNYDVAQARKRVPSRQHSRARSMSR